LTFCVKSECCWSFSSALEVGISVNTPVISQLSCPHWSMRGTFDCGVDFPGCQLCACGDGAVLPRTCPRTQLTCAENQHHSRMFGACFGASNWTVKSLECSQRLVLQELSWNLHSIESLGRKSVVYTDRMIEINLLGWSLTGLSLSRCPYFCICIRSQTLLYAHGQLVTRPSYMLTVNLFPDLAIC
jgi:hypothetical protein